MSKPFFSLHHLLLSGLFLLHDSCCNLRDDCSSINSGHSCWLPTAPDPPSPSSARNIHQNTLVLSHADYSCIKRPPYSEEACNHHRSPATSCAYDAHLSGPTDSPIRPDNMASEVGAGRYPQQGSEQGLTTPPVTLQHRTPSGGLLLVGDEATPTPPRHAIMLMGVLMSPEVAPNSSSKMLASIKHKENMLSSPRATVFSSQDHTGNGDVTAQTISTGVISGKQDQIIPKRNGWNPLKFDVSVFESPVADAIDRHKIRQIWELINRLKKGPQLQMNTREFRKFHTKVFSTFLRDSKASRCNSKTDRNDTGKKCVAACRALYGKKDFWFRRWDAMLNHPHRLIALRLQLQQKTQYEALALVFLFFVEMICVLISPHWDEEAVKEQMHKALEILEELFHPTSSPSSSSSVRLSAQASKSNHHSAPLHPPMSSQPTWHQSDIFTQLARRGNFYVIPPLWVLLERWIFTHRKLFAKEIIPKRITSTQNVKRFFNNIFYLSINNLNRRHS